MTAALRRMRRGRYLPMAIRLQRRAARRHECHLPRHKSELRQADKEHEMKVICATCKRSLDWKAGKGQTGVSHGICPVCAKAALADLKRKREEA